MSAVLMWPDSYLEKMENSLLFCYWCSPLEFVLWVWVCCSPYKWSCVVVSYFVLSLTSADYYECTWLFLGLSSFLSDDHQIRLFHIRAYVRKCHFSLLATFSHIGSLTPLIYFIFSNTLNSPGQNGYCKVTRRNKSLANSVQKASF